jgi:preprotein translocase SecE subunit
MAVAVKNVPETTPQQSYNRLAVGSLLGTLYVVASIALIFYAIPGLWGWALGDLLIRSLGAAVNTALLILVLVLAAGGLAVYGVRWVAAHEVPGMRAGICTGLVFLFLVGVLTRWAGSIFENLITRGQWFGESGLLVGMIATAIIALALLIGAGRFFFKPGFEHGLVRMEGFGWFTAAGYKRSQGQRVRRGSMLALLLLAGCGIYTMLAHHTLETGAKDWQVAIPFAERSLTLLPDVRFTLPILLAGLTLWVSYRLVNFPPFADFLIATEAELNKVSWPTRKRLVQDTMVVLTTMALTTIFLFAVDVGWVFILERPWIQVLQTPPSAVDVKQLDSQIEQLSQELEAAKAEKDTDRILQLNDKIEELQKKKEGTGREVDW